MFDADTYRTLAGIGTATITMQMLKQGIRNTVLRGARPWERETTPVSGPAFTMRFLPAREDLSRPEALANGRSSRNAVEEVETGQVVVVDAAGRADSGVMGDILCARLHVLGAAALVTDGAVRDARGLRQVPLPIWCAGTTAPPSIASLAFVDWQQPISCGGTPVFPGETIVADSDGVIVIPDLVVSGLLEDGLDQNEFEDWVLNEVRGGAPLPGLYPPSAATLERYRAR